MAYAPGAGGTRTASRTPTSRTAANGKPGQKRTPVGSGRGPSKAFLAGLGIGLAVGAAAALLLAPQSGAETRRAIRNRGLKVRNKARSAWDDLRIELEATRRALKRKRAAEVEATEAGR